MSPDGWELFTRVALVIFMVAGFDLGMAALMRGGREASTDD